MRVRLVSIGEILWDLLPGRRQLGGAPGNVACHARSLGADASLITRVGADSLGEEIVALLTQRGLPRELIQVDSTAPTGTVGVRIDAQGQAAYTIHPNVAWDRLATDATSLEAVRTADAICFGSLAQRAPVSRETLRQLVQASPATALRVFDVNLRPPFIDPDVIRGSLELANACKLNEDELPQIAEMLGLRPGDSQAQIVELSQRFALRLVALTRGARGSLLFNRTNWSDRPSPKVEVRDTVGAGDSFTAAMIAGHLAGWPLDQVNERAADVAGYVCTQPGATPELPAALREPYVNAAA